MGWGVFHRRIQNTIQKIWPVCKWWVPQDWDKNHRKALKRDLNRDVGFMLWRLFPQQDGKCLWIGLREERVNAKPAESFGGSAYIISYFKKRVLYVSCKYNVRIKGDYDLKIVLTGKTGDYAPDSNAIWANVGPMLGQHYRRWASVGAPYIAVWDIHVENWNTVFTNTPTVTLPQSRNIKWMKEMFTKQKNWYDYMSI